MTVSLVVSGCGAAAQNPNRVVGADGSSKSSATRRAAEKAERKILNSGPAEVSVSNEKGELVWKLAGTSSRIGLVESAGAEAFMNGVSGQFFDGGKQVSSFRAKTAKANTDQKTFKLLDRVSVKSTEYGAELQADEVEWLEGQQVMAAKGNVTVKTDGWTFGPADVIYTNKTLTQIGSPDTFKK